VPDHKLIRLSIAMVWFYQGLWCKVLGGVPRQEAVISAAPFICAAEVRLALTTLGLVECGALPSGSCQDSGCDRLQPCRPHCLQQ
jgi:hypothetical protein